MSQTIKNIFYKQRTDFEQSLAKRDSELSFPEGVEVISDISYAADDSPSHRLDIYRPFDKNDQELPVVINIHGGGLILGCKEFNRYFCARFSKLGYLVISIEYRLVPDCLFFDQCEDIFSAFQYIREHLTEYHGNINELYATGDSGGACLLTYCTAMQNQPAVAKTANVTPHPLPIKALGLISGMFYTNKLDSIGLFLPRYLYGRHYRRTAYAPYINPEHPDIIRSLPPCFLVTSERDNLRHYTMQFEKALARCDHTHVLLDFPDDARLTHAFSVFEPFLPESTKTIQAMSDYFQQINTSTNDTREETYELR